MIIKEYNVLMNCILSGEPPISPAKFLKIYSDIIS